MTPAIRSMLLKNKFSPLDLKPALWLKADGMLWQLSLADPTTAATGNPVGGGATGGSLQAGTYKVQYTFVTTQGETLVGTSESGNIVAGVGNIPRITFPALPTGASSINLYSTAAGGGSGTETLYATGITGTTYDMSAAQTAGLAPPTVNRAVATPALADADPDGAWDDASGNSRHAIQATTTKRPALKLAIQNGLPILRFDGTDDFLSIPNVAALKPTASFSYCVVLKTTSLVTVQQALRGASAAVDGNYGFTLSPNGSTAGKYGFVVKTGTDNVLEATIPNTNQHVVLATYDGATQSLRVDGTSVSQALTGSVVYGTGNTCIGSTGAVSSSLPLGGDIAELLLFPYALSVIDATSLEAYLKVKWGTP